MYRSALAGLLRSLGGRGRSWLAVGLVATLAACGGGSASDPQAKGDVQASAKTSVGAVAAVNVTTLSVNKLVLKAERRITRTVFEYDYQVEIKNNGGALTGVLAQLTAVGAGTSIVDGSVSVGAIAAGATVLATDIITLRHDRSLPFQPAALVWQFQSDPVALVALPGNPSDPAVDNVPEYEAQVSFPTSAIDQDLLTGATVLRSKLVIGFKPGSTVAQVNAMLQSINATIVRTYAKTGLLEVRIPDPGSQAALNALLVGLRAQPVVRYAFAVRFASTDALPAALQGKPTGDLEYVAHHLAVKAGPAWNARRATQLSGAAPLGPVFLLFDSFGGGAPAPAPNLLDGTLIGAVGSGFTTTPITSNHGYHVLGIAVGSYNGTNDSADSSPISGLYGAVKPLLLEIDDWQPDKLACSKNPPATLLVSCSGKTVEDRLRTMLFAYSQIDRKLIVNTSLGTSASGGLGETGSADEKAYWLDVLRGGFGGNPNPLEARYFHAASAGNNAAMPAKYNKGWTRAAIDGDLTNTAVVENRQADGATFAMGCLYNGNSGASGQGNVSAVGSLSGSGVVWSYADKAGSPIGLGGASMATPQVAGLAASFWAIRSDVTSSQLLSIIRSHAVAEGSCPGNPGQPLIDAYATLLAADDPEALAGAMGNPLKAPVRLAILDVDEDNTFTLDDAKLFVAAMVANPGATAFDTATTALTTVQTPTGPKKVDRSRFDLNGEGKLGGPGFARFNLDISYGPQRNSTYGKVSYASLPGQVVELDETAVTDFQVLCYYVRSKLFNPSKGDFAAFETHLASLTPKLTCMGGAVVGVELKINDIVAGWSGLPATISMSTLYGTSVPAFQVQGNSATCSNQGEPLGERGTPLFSNSVEAGAQFSGARVVSGVPNPSSSGVVNRNNCSSFFAYKVVTVPGIPEPQAKFWVNATGRAVFGFGSAVVSDWEYQVRYYSGDPASNYADRKVLVGVVPGSGVFQTSFQATSTSLNYIVAPPVQ